jgi:hypothetical protein
MAEKKTTPIVINGNNYVYEDMTPEQQYLFDNCVDLDRKIGSAAFNLEQLKVGKDAFLGKLTASLGAIVAQPVEKAEVEVVQ